MTAEASAKAVGSATGFNVQFQPGFQLGQYELEDILGAGGMGTVYRALDRRLERRVAIKMIQPITGMDVASQLLAEARAACALNHPNICTVHEVGESGAHAFIVMECIEGPSLSQVMAEGPVSRDRAMDLSIQIAGALTHAHERGVVHGDLKAANVLVTSTDRIKVVDFGLAQRRKPDEAHTATVETVGTPYAMAPEQEALVPHQPFVEALQWYARQCPAGVLDDHLENVDGIRELVQLLPTLARRVTRLPDLAESNPESQRFRLFEAVSALMAAMARTRPVLLVLEDLHWADKPTLLMLRHLFRSSHEAALAVVATYRETELGRTHPLAEILGDLRSEQGIVRIALKGLGATDVREFIERWIGRVPSEPVARAVAENTDGNPFFISEVLRHLTETGALERFEKDPRAGSDLGLPEGVREAIGRRLARVSDTCNKVLSLAAVIGREFTLPVLEPIAELPSNRLLDVVDEAIAAKLIHDAPGAPERYTFTHALVRDTLYTELTVVRRARLHRAVAQALERVSTGEPPFADLAHHFTHGLAAEDAHKAVDYAERAAAKAASTFALEEAARFYQAAIHALDLLPPDSPLQQRRLDLHVRRARASTDIGAWAMGRHDLEEALKLVAPVDRIRRTELLLEHLALSLTGAGRYAEARRTFDEMRDFGRRHGTLPMLARGIAMSAGLHISLGDYATGEAIAREARELARRIVFAPPFVSAGVDLLIVHARTHEPGRAELLIGDVAKAVAESSGWHGWLWRLRLSQAKAELALARQDWQTAVDRATEGITESRARSRPKYVALGLLTRAQAKHHLHDVPGAIEDASAAVAVARTLGDPAVLLSALTALLAVDGNDALLAEARGCVERMAANIDAAELRQYFLDSEIARGVRSLGA